MLPMKMRYLNTSILVLCGNPHYYLLRAEKHKMNGNSTPFYFSLDRNIRIKHCKNYKQKAKKNHQSVDRIIVL